MGRVQIAAVYLEAADGPTILTELVSPAGVQQLRQLFVRMAEGGGPIHLGEQPGVRLLNGLTIELSSGGDGSNRLRRTGSDLTFAWDATLDQWRDTAAMVQAVYEHPGSHNYLADEPDTDAVMEITYGEPLLRRPSTEPDMSSA